LRKNRSLTALSQQLPFRPGEGGHWQIAIGKAAHTSSSGMLGAITQSTTLREYKSSTAARYSQPLPVRRLYRPPRLEWPVLA